MKIGAGAFTKSIVLKAPTTTRNSEGGRELTFPTNTIQTWARVDEINSQRVMEAGATALIGTKIFYFRYAERMLNVTKDWILVYNGKNYTISNIEQVDEKEKFIKITAKAKSSGT